MEKYKSLELRLMGCMRTIKTLERENQAKSDKLSSLALELDKKTKLIETLNAEKNIFSQSQQRQQIQTQITTHQKKKEQELTTKVKDQESLLNEQKKQLTRYQELNKSLLDKVKELEIQLQEKPPIEDIMNWQSTSLSAEEEINRLKREVERARAEAKQTRINERQKCEYIERECCSIKEKYESLKESSCVFERATQKLYLSYVAINERLKQYEQTM